MQANSLANGPTTQIDWQSINWKRANRNVRNLRQRIFRATQEEDWKKVRSLQKLMLRSLSNVLVSVRRVTQINQGKRTAGVDRLVVKTPKARTDLVKDLVTLTPWRAKPARRIYIPKSNGKQRPLGIPVIRDRCLQAMVKNALEPEWEARFERSSYGFRPGRSAHDAIKRIRCLSYPQNRKKWVLDADIKGAFDNISHTFLLDTIQNVPGRELIRQWLKAGYMEDTTCHPTESGTPQGGVISPLLANIALHGMEQALEVRYGSDGTIRSQRAIVRYADDFVVFCESEADARQCQSILTDWLATRGLQLSPEKTHILHLQEGFDFLGFHIRHYPTPQTSKTGWTLVIKPNKKSVNAIRAKLRYIWRTYWMYSPRELIRLLNPIIRGWANYFRKASAKKIFASLDHWMTIRAIRYAKYRHPRKPAKWWYAKYFGQYQLGSRNRWIFGDQQSKAHLLTFASFPIERHIMVKGLSSPDDPQLQDYWLQRERRKKTDLTRTRQKVATRQKGCCPHCGESLFNGEHVEVHHLQPKKQGGTDRYANLQLVHLYCHQQITAEHEKNRTTS